MDSEKNNFKQHILIFLMFCLATKTINRRISRSNDINISP